MIRNLCKGKIHRATVTEADLNYVGSITIDSFLLESAGIVPYEQVLVTNLSNGEAWTTYTIRGEAHSGVICLNGPPARKFHQGDKVIIMCFSQFSESELQSFTPRIVFVDEANAVVDVKVDRQPLLDIPGLYGRVQLEFGH